MFGLMTGARLARRFVRAALALAIGSPLGCTLLLDATTEPGPHCNFSGRDTSACGLCLAKRCQLPIDQCCGDAGCQAALDVIDRCAGHADVDACRALQDGTTPVPEPVSACARASCAVECSGGQAITSCDSSGDSCQCTGTTGDQANGEVCTDASIEDGVCCADIGYPDTQLLCSCDRYQCKPTADGCSCGIATEGPWGSCAGAICCFKSIFECHCGSAPCAEYEQPVPACTPDTVTCDLDQVQVTACSRTAP
jgi:hypothetical protein